MFGQLMGQHAKCNRFVLQQLKICKNVCCSTNMEGYQQRVQERMVAWEQKKQAHKEAKRAEHAEMLRPMVWQLVTLAERSISYCQSLDAAAVPRSTWRDWAQAFVQGCLEDEDEAEAEAGSAAATAGHQSQPSHAAATPADKAAALVRSTATKATDSWTA